MDEQYEYTSQYCQYNHNYSQEQLLALANAIWQEVKKDKQTDLDSLYVSVFDKYKDFGMSFPLILRWMVQMKKFSEKAFKKFLIKYSSSKVNSKKDFLILQAEYLVYLYEESKHYSKSDVVQYREFIIKQLLEEDALFDKVHEEVQIEEKKNKEVLSKESREKLYNYLLNNK